MPRSKVQDVDPCFICGARFDNNQDALRHEQVLHGSNICVSQDANIVYGPGANLDETELAAYMREPPCVRYNSKRPKI
jgi:hypothetical protein